MPTRTTRWSRSAARTAPGGRSPTARRWPADAIGQALIERGLGPACPLLILSGNGVNHLLMTLGALTAGVPVAPVSVAYSLQSKDHARIRAITELIAPGAAYVDGAAAFGPALDAVGVPAIIGAGSRPGAGTVDELRATAPGRRCAALSRRSPPTCPRRSCSPPARPVPPRAC